MSLADKVAALRAFFVVQPELPLLPAVEAMHAAMGSVAEGALPGVGFPVCRPRHTVAKRCITVSYCVNPQTVSLAANFTRTITTAHVLSLATYWFGRITCVPEWEQRPNRHGQQRRTQAVRFLSHGELTLARWI